MRGSRATPGGAPWLYLVPGALSLTMVLPFAAMALIDGAIFRRDVDGRWFSVAIVVCGVGGLLVAPGYYRFWQMRQGASTVHESERPWIRASLLGAATLSAIGTPLGVLAIVPAISCALTCYGAVSLWLQFERS